MVRDNFPPDTLLYMTRGTNLSSSNNHIIAIYKVLHDFGDRLHVKLISTTHPIDLRVGTTHMYHQNNLANRNEYILDRFKLYHDENYEIW